MLHPPEFVRSGSSLGAVSSTPSLLFAAQAVPLQPFVKAKRREVILWVEGIGFGMIIVLTWVTEYLHVPHLLYAEDPKFLWGRAVLRSVVIGLVWLAVHLATRKLLKRLHQLEEFLLVCAWCRKIGHNNEWVSMEEYFGSALSTPTTHGICPECSRTVKQTIEHDRVSAD